MNALLPSMASLVVSILFTIVAVRYPDEAPLVAVPIGLAVIGLLVVTAARVRKARRCPPPRH